MSIRDKAKKFVDNNDTLYGDSYQEALDSYESGYKECLVDLKKEINRLTVERYQFPLLHIFDWIDKNLGVK